MAKGSARSLDDVVDQRPNLNLIISLDFKFFDLKLYFKFEISAWHRCDCLSREPFRAPCGAFPSASMNALLRAFRAPIRRGVSAHLRTTVQPTSPLAIASVVAAKSSCRFDQSEKCGIEFAAAKKSTGLTKDFSKINVGSMAIG